MMFMDSLVVFNSCVLRSGGWVQTPLCPIRGTDLMANSDGRACGHSLAIHAYFHMATDRLGQVKLPQDNLGGVAT
jgi:hypothetical protein